MSVQFEGCGKVTRIDSVRLAHNFRLFKRCRLVTSESITAEIQMREEVVGVTDCNHPAPGPISSPISTRIA